MKLAIPLVIADIHEKDLPQLHYSKNDGVCDVCELCGKVLLESDTFFDEPELLNAMMTGVLPMPVAMMNTVDRIVLPYILCTVIHTTPAVVGKEKH